MEWLKNFNKSIEYIEKNLAGEISYDEAASIACCSTYYFQRMFSYVAGVSLSAYIRRRRMTQAAFEMRNSDAKITEIGLKYGYTSPTAFNRAFRDIHGVSPAAARTGAVQLAVYPAINFKITITGSERMQYRFETKEAFRIVGMRVSLQEEMAENFKIVPRFWAKARKDNRLSEICSLAASDDKKLLGVSIYASPYYIYYYIAVATDKPVPKGMTAYEVPKATWVVLESDGCYPASIQRMYQRFLTEWLPFSGYRYAELPDVEVYSGSDRNSGAGHAEIWIAVEKE